MKKDRFVVGLSAVWVLLSILGINGCKKTFSLDSAWLDRKITIDGKADDWHEGHLYVDEDISSRIGIYNDDDALYVCLMVRDQGIERQIFEQGISMWVSKSGESSKVWGLHCLMETEGAEETWHQGEAEGEGEPGKTGSRNGRPGNQRRQTESLNSPISLKQYELLTSEKEAGHIMSTGDFSKFGIRTVVSRDDQGGFVCEVKIPLNKTEETPYAARQSKKQRVVLGFLTPKASASVTRDIGGRGGFGSGTRNGDDMAHIDMFNGDGGGGSWDQGGMGGGGMGRSGKERGGSARSGARKHQAENLDFWSVIELATNPVESR